MRLSTTTITEVAGYQQFKYALRGEHPQQTMALPLFALYRGHLGLSSDAKCKGAGLWYL